MSNASERPFIVDSEEYPFEDQWVDIDGAGVHYVDEGEGACVLMLHGNPTWSFVYRKVIKGLSGQCRCIAPDYPGFGYSEHPPGYGYTPQEHAGRITALINHLGLERFILIVQDWGGPIGLSVAVEQSDRIAGIVLCNTWCWRPTVNLHIFSCIMGGPIGRYLILHHNFFAKVLVPGGVFNRQAKTPAILKAYTDPFGTPASRIGTYIFGRQIRKASGWLESIEGRLSVLREKPVEMVWGMKDPAFGRQRCIRKWLGHFPNANLERIENASHYLQEDSPDRIVCATERLLDKIRDER
jgi:haloalkane dehalogenase